MSRRGEKIQAADLNVLSNPYAATVRNGPVREAGT